MTSNICTNCENILDPGDLFCSKCGKTVLKKNVKSGKLSKDILIIGGILAAILIVVLLVRSPEQSSNSHQHSGSEGHEHNTEDGIRMIEEIARLEQIMAADPADCETKLQLAHLYQDAGKLKESIGAYSSYLEEHPDNGEARIDLGVSFYRLAFEDSSKQKEYFQKALVEMKTGLQYSPDNQVGLFNIGIVNFQSGNLQEAIKYFNKCIDVNPETQIASKAKEILENHIN